MFVDLFVDTGAAHIQECYNQTENTWNITHIKYFENM